MKTRPKTTKVITNGKKQSIRGSQRRNPQTLQQSLESDAAAISDLLRKPISLLMTNADLENALGLLEHLTRCHRAALCVPGVGLALFHTQDVGIHCADPAYRFVSALLYEAERMCRGILAKETRS